MVSLNRVSMSTEFYKVQLPRYSQKEPGSRQRQFSVKDLFIQIKTDISSQLAQRELVLATLISNSVTLFAFSGTVYSLSFCVTVPNVRYS